MFWKDKPRHLRLLIVASASVVAAVLSVPILASVHPAWGPRVLGVALILFVVAVASSVRQTFLTAGRTLDDMERYNLGASRAAWRERKHFRASVYFLASPRFFLPLAALGIALVLLGLFLYPT